MIVPEPLTPGATLYVVAPSSPFDRTLVWRGMGWLAQHYRLRYDSGLFAKEGFLAGDDSRRVAELKRALSEPDVAAIVAARGGYGLSRIATRLLIERLTSSPRWLVGFSDFTVLHVEAARIGIASLHAHNVAGLGRGDARARQAWKASLESPHRARTVHDLESWYPGSAQGQLFGGNLAILHACAAAGRLLVPRGAILVIEDVGEASYRVDRALTTLMGAGHLERAAAVVVGDFTDCALGQHGVRVEDVLRERLGRLRVPVLSGLEFGHGRHNLPLPLGLQARADASAGTLELGLPATP